MRGLIFVIYIPVAVTILTGSCLLADGASLPVINGSSTLYNGNYEIHKEIGKEMLKVMQNCTLYPKFNEGKEHIAKLVSDGNTHVKVSIEIDGDNGPFSEDYAGHIFRPYNWIIVTSLTGKSMLMLKEYFVEMSIQTFGQGVVKADLTLVQDPSDCLKNNTQEEIENTIRRLFLKNFDPDGTLLLEGAEICNRHVQEIDREGQVVYICCQENSEKTLECSEVHNSTLMKVLFQFITVLKWLAVSCFPLFIPYSVYKARNEFRKYIFETEQNDDMELNMRKISKLSETDSKTFEEAKLQSYTHMTHFKRHIEEHVKKLDTIYKCHVKGVLLTVRNSKIIAKGRAPVSVLSFLNSFFVRCKIRHVIPSGNECCDAKIFKCLKNDRCKKCKCTWYNCLNYPMELVSVAVCFVPLLIRLIYYALYERPFIRDQIELMERRNLSLYIDKSEITEYPLTNLLSSDYLYYVIIVYSLIPTELLIYKLRFPIDLKRKVKSTFRKSVRDMRLTKKSELCSCYIGASIRPLQKCGIFGIPIFTFYFLFLCVPFTIEVIPVCNFIGRLLKNISAKDEIKMNKVKLIFHGLSQVLVVWTMFLLLVLIMECISFYVEWFIYVLIGFILNPRVSLRHASMIVLITVYGHECFSGVHNRYVAYNNAINSQVVGMVSKRIKEVASLSEEEQGNTVFRVPTQTKSFRKERNFPFKIETAKKEDNTLFPLHKLMEEKKISNSKEKERVFERGSEGFLKWRAPRLVLFSDKSDMCIPKSFLFRMAKLPHYFCLGPVHLLYLKAVKDFSLIIVFLVFVFIVIFAFGQVQDVSTGGQTIAALGSGLLPLFLRRFLFRSHDPPDVDSTDLQWRYMFENAVQMYSERWDIEDMYVSGIEEINSKVGTQMILDTAEASQTCADASQTSVTSQTYIEASQTCEKASQTCEEASQTSAEASQTSETRQTCKEASQTCEKASQTCEEASQTCAEASQTWQKPFTMQQKYKWKMKLNKVVCYKHWTLLRNKEILNYRHI